MTTDGETRVEEALTYLLYQTPETELYSGLADGLFGARD